MMIIENLYGHGQIVFLKTDKEQQPRCVVSIEVFKNGELLYRLVCGTESSTHYDFEISSEKDLNLAINA